MKKYLFFTLFYFFFSLCCFAQNKKQKADMEAVEHNLMPYVPVKGFVGWDIKERMKYYGVPAVSIAVIKNFKIEWAKSYGWADTTKKVVAQNNTMYSAGSISKLLTATIAMKLVQAKKIDLDLPINNYLKSWKLGENDFTKNKPVTLRMLLSHTAGTSQSSYWGFLPTKNSLPTVVEILNGEAVAESRKVVVNSEPDKAFQYSGGGTMIVQMVIMDILGKDFETIAQEQIFVPLQMKNSTFDQTAHEKRASQMAWGYSNASWYKGVPYVYPQQAAAGLYTTATDLAIFMAELQKCYAGKGKLLQQAYTKMMVMPKAVISQGNYKEQIGLGAFLLEKTGNTSSKGKYFEHQGANAGFISYAMGSVEGGNGVVILMNTGDDFNGFGTELRRAVAKVYGWHNFLPTEIAPITLLNNELEEYVGRYRKGIDEVIYIGKENSYLVEKINEGRDIYCFPIAKDSIVFTDFNTKGKFDRDENGKVIGLRYEWQEKPMPKMKDNEFSPSEHLKNKRYAEAKEGFKAMNWNEYQITYMAYELFNKKNADLEAVKTVLTLASELYPQSAIVNARWGDFYLFLNERSKALQYYEKALQIEPNDNALKEKIEAIKK